MSLGLLVSFSTLFIFTCAAPVGFFRCLLGNPSLLVVQTNLIYSDCHDVWPMVPSSTAWPVAEVRVDWRSQVICHLALLWEISLVCWGLETTSMSSPPLSYCLPFHPIIIFCINLLEHHFFPPPEVMQSPACSLVMCFACVTSWLFYSFMFLLLL